MAADPLSHTGHLKEEQSTLATRDAELASCQKQLGLASVQLREAQRAMTAAEAAQATAAASLEAKAGHISSLQQQLAEAQVSVVSMPYKWHDSCALLLRLQELQSVYSPAGCMCGEVPGGVTH
jgi:chromosome segregation ATPase